MQPQGPAPRNGIWQGEPYERHFFTEIAFDVPIDEATFYPEGRPAT